tara:strand:+ start:801 stop:1709 length:909 start_codon:yes stop_codon:yes gene_type:complete
MQNLATKLFQKFILNQDIRKFKNNLMYYCIFRLVRKILNSKIEVKIYNFKILASNKKNTASHALLRKCDFTDNSEKKLIREISTKNKIFLIDCGSNFGFYSLFSASLSTNNKIISLEASPKTYVDHKENIIINNFQNIELFNLAVSEKDGQTLKLIESKNDWESSISHDEFDKIHETKIKTISIDTLLEKKNIKDFDLIIKLDIEGHEMNAIEGALKSVKNFNPLIIIEFSKFMQKNNYYNFDFLKNFIKNFDYSIFDEKYNKITVDEVINKLNNLPNNHNTVGNNFLAKNESKIENIILNL